MTNPAKEPTDFALEGARVGRNAALLASARFAGMGLTLIQNGVIFRALSPESVGKFAFAWSFAALFTVLATLGLGRVMIREIARNPEQAWTEVWSALLFISGLVTLTLGGIAVTAFGLYDDPEKTAAVLFAALWVVGIWAVQLPFEAILYARERMSLLAILYFTTAILKLTAVILTVTSIPSSAAAHAALAGANAIGLCLAIALAVRVAGWSKPRFNLPRVVEQVKEGIPISIAVVCSLIYFKSDMTLLNFIRGDAGTAIYAPVQRLMEPLLMIAALWGTAIFPALCRMAHADTGHYGRMRQLSVRTALFLSCPMGVGLALLAEPILDLFTGDVSEFPGAVRVMQIYAVIVPLFYFNGVALEFFYSDRRVWFVVRAYATAAVVNVGANLLLIPEYGPTGLAIAAILANATGAIWFITGLRRELRGMGLFPLLAKTALACAVMAVLAHTTAALNLWLAVLLAIPTYLALLLVLRAFNNDEREILIGLSKTLRKIRE